MSPIRTVSLQQLVDGGLGEDFDRELDRVLANLSDPNTDPKKTRTITITIGVKPLDESRTNVLLSEKVEAKLAGSRTHKTAAMIDDAGIWTNSGADPLQRDLLDADDPTIAKLETKKAQGGEA